MNQYRDQIIRIKDKLRRAKESSDTSEFGADSHQFIIRKKLKEADIKAVEEQYNILLPDDFKIFLKEVGSRGISFAGSAAGPGYGIYPLGERITELCANFPDYLSQPAIVSPDMTDAEWLALTSELKKHNDAVNKEMDEMMNGEGIDSEYTIPENDTESENSKYEEDTARIFSGIMPLGTKGCTFLYGLVLAGKDKGRVVNLDTEICGEGEVGDKPRFADQHNFLDWYEYWLDRIVLTEQEIVAKYKEAKTDLDKALILNHLFLQDRLKKSTITLLIDEYHTASAKLKKRLIDAITKYSYKDAKPLLENISTEMDFAEFISLISVFVPERKYVDWYEFIEKNISKSTNDDVLLDCVRLLQDMKVPYGDIVLPFTQHENGDIRATAYYALGELKNVSDYQGFILEGLKDSNEYVLISISSVLREMKLEDIDLILSLYEHWHEQIRMACIIILRERRDRSKYQDLFIRALDDESALIVYHAMQALVKVSSKNEKYIIPMTRHQAIKVRQDAFGILSYSKNSSKYTDLFMEGLRNERIKNRYLRFEIISVLVQALYSMDKDILEILSPLLSHEDADIRENAVWGLSCLPDQIQYYDIYTGLLDDPSMNVVRTVNQVISDMEEFGEL